MDAVVATLLDCKLLTDKLKSCVMDCERLPRPSPAVTMTPMQGREAAAPPLHITELEDNHDEARAEDACRRAPRDTSA